MGKTKPSTAALKRTTKQAVVKQQVEDQPIKRKRVTVQPEEDDEDVFDQDIIVLPAAKTTAAAKSKKQKTALKNIPEVEDVEEIVPETKTRKKQKSVAKKVVAPVESEDEEEIVPAKKASMSSKETLAAIKESGMVLSPKTASSSLKQVLSFQATQEMSVQMAKMQDELYLYILII
jgi:hypothetical protein